MIVLDTNVVSEFMASSPAVAVQEWLNDQDGASLYFTAISIAEISFGLRILPEGKRQRLLTDRFEAFVAAAFDSRVLSFDEAAGRVYGEILGLRRAEGRPMSNFDGQIAAIASMRGFTVATRNTKDFADCGLQLVNPFSRTG